MAKLLEGQVKMSPKLKRNLQALANKAPKAAGESLLFRAESMIMTDAKRDYVPVDKGPLRASGHVVLDPVKISVTLGFGGPAGTGNQGETNAIRVGYAVIQHEETSFNHAVGEDHYLEKPLMRAVAGDFFPMVGKDIMKAIEAGVM